MGAIPRPTANVALEPLAVSAQQLARTLGISIRTIRTMDAGAKLPRPIRLNGSVRWIVTEIESWLAAGAPDRATWETLRNHK